jgi:hypothetical protein
MSQQISSMQTFIMKVIFPVVWITAFGFGTLMLWLDAMHDKVGAPPPDEMKWQFLLIWIIGTTFISWLSLPLKQVRVDSTNLYISNYLKEVSTPLKNISDVTENRWINIHPVTIHFRNPTEFGHKITFMPTVRFFALWSSHPIVEELKRWARTGRC